MVTAESLRLMSSFPGSSHRYEYLSSLGIQAHHIQLIIAELMKGKVKQKQVDYHLFLEICQFSASFTDDDLDIIISPSTATVSTQTPASSLATPTAQSVNILFQ